MFLAWSCASRDVRLFFSNFNGVRCSTASGWALLRAACDVGIALRVGAALQDACAVSSHEFESEGAKHRATQALNVGREVDAAVVPKPVQDMLLETGSTSP